MQPTEAEVILDSFFKEFGEMDIYKKIVLEEVLNWLNDSSSFSSSSDLGILFSDPLPSEDS